VREAGEGGATGRGPALSALRDPGFLVLAIEFAFVTTAEWAFTTALAIQAFEIGGALAVGLAGARFVPAAVAGIPLSTLGDRRPPAWVLAGTAAARCTALLLALAVVVSGGPFWLLLAIAVTDAMVGMAYRPAQARLIPALARTPADVAGAAALLTNTKTVSQVAGAILAGILVSLGDIELAVAVPAGLYLVAALGNAAFAERLHARAAKPPAGQGDGDWLEGLRVLTGNAHVGHVAAISAVRSLGRGLWLALATLAALGFLELGQGGVGLLFALSGIGVLVSLPVSAVLVARPYLRPPLTLALVLCGIPLIVVAVTQSAAPAFLAVAVWGFGMAFADVNLVALQLRVVDAPVLSRTIGAIESLKIGAEGAGALLAPALVAVLGLRAAIAAAGVLPIAVALLQQGPLRAVDVVAARRTDLLLLLRRVPLFGSLGVEALERLAAGARRELVAPGVDIVREGDPDARDFYVVERGSAEVRLGDWPVAQIGAGEAFGERALLRDAPRAATVRTLDDLTVWAIDRDTFITALTGTAREATLARPRDADPGSLVDVLRTLPLLGNLGQSQLNQLAASGDLRSVSAGETIIREGEEGDELFVILHGEARVERGGRTVVDLLPGDHVGEIALLHDVPRSATVRVTRDALLLAIGRPAYQAVAQPQRLGTSERVVAGP